MSESISGPAYHQEFAMPAAGPSPLFPIIGALAAHIALFPGPAAATESGSGRIVGSGVNTTESRAVSGFHGFGLGLSNVPREVAEQVAAQCSPLPALEGTRRMESRQR